MDRWSLISVEPFKSFAICRVSSHAEFLRSTVYQKMVSVSVVVAEAAATHAVPVPPQ